MIQTLFVPCEELTGNLRDDLTVFYSLGFDPLINILNLI